MMFSTCSLTEFFRVSVGRARPWASVSTITIQEQKRAAYTAIMPSLGVREFVL